mgnify:CR=1 FL=1
MKRFGHVYEKIYEDDNIDRAIRTGCRNRKNKKEVAEFKEHLDEYRKRMIYEIKTETFRIAGYHEFRIVENGKTRIIRKVSLYDAIVLNAFCQVLEPFVDKKLTPESHGARKGHGTHSAMRAVFKHLQHPKANYVLQTDVEGFFKNMDPNVTKQKIRKVFKDPKIIRFFDNLIDSYPDGETPIGNRTSPMLANLYLRDVLFALSNRYKVHMFTNYVDDTIIHGFSKKWLHFILNVYRKLLAEIKLKIKSNYQVYPVEPRGVDFVGWVIHKDYIHIRKRTKLKMIKAARRMYAKMKKGIEPTVHDRSSIGSYVGMLRWCNGYRLYCKYLRPIVRYFKAWDKRKAYIKKASPGAI